MKKWMGLSLLAVVMVMMLTACGKFECGMCNEEKSGKKHKTEVFGEEIVICDDCYEDIQELKDAFR